MAQIVPDSTLATEVASPDGRNFLIQAGTRSGSNLFHSFEQFSIPTAGAAVFNQSPEIETIISRITGGDRSILDGELIANGTADLFLINPAGIIFGPNASLSIGGSFLATTAQQLSFADGTVLQTDGVSSVPPQLTISRPVGLTLTANSGAITAIGRGHNLTAQPPLFETDRSLRPLGLAVNSDQSLALIGNNVVLQGATLTTAGGHIDVGSVANGSVVLPSASGAADYAEVTEFADIQLARAAAIDASGPGGGNIALQGQTVRLTDGSAILSDTLGAVAGGTIALRASDSATIGGASATFLSGVYADVASGATARGSDLLIETDQLRVFDGGFISVSTFGAGDAGNTVLKADTVEAFGTLPNSLVPTGIVSQSILGTGSGGDIIVEADRLRVAGGGQVGTGAFGRGRSGNLTVNANSVEVDGTDASGSIFSSLATQVNTESIGGVGGLLTINAKQVQVSDLALISAAIARGGQGQAGTINIDTEALNIRGGGQITTSTLGQGEAGDLRVRASSVDITGNGSINNRLVRSAISTAVNPSAAGDGGDIFIAADRLSLSENGAILSRTAGQGNAGNIALDVPEIQLSTLAILESGVGSNGIGNGGDIDINATNLTLSSGSQFVTRTLGQGNSGRVRVRAETVDIEGGDLFLGNDPVSSGITASTETEARGDGGDVFIVTDRLSLTAGGFITNSTQGEGNAGNVEIQAREVAVAGASPFESLPNSEISSRTESTGTGGDVAIDTEQLTVADGSQISVRSLATGTSGDIDVRARNVRLDGAAVLDAQTGAGERGNINAEARIVLLNRNSNIVARAVAGQGGNIQLTTGQLLQSDDSFVDASSQFGVDGTVVFNELTDTDPEPVELAEAVITADQLVANSCLGTRDRSSGRFVVSGAGGLSTTPTDPARSTFETYTIPQEAFAAGAQPPPVIVEAQAAYRLNDGRVVFVQRCL